MKIKTVWCLSETSRVLNVFKCDSFLFWQTSRRTRRSRSSQRKKGQSLNPSRCSRGWATKENRARVHARTKHSRDMDTQTHARSPLRGDDRETLDQRWLEEQREVKTMQQTDEWTLSCSELPLCSHLASIIVFVSGVLSTRIFRTYVCGSVDLWNMWRMLLKWMHWTFQAYLCHLPQTSCGSAALIIQREEGASLQDLSAL